MPRISKNEKLKEFMNERVPVFIPRGDAGEESVTVTLNGVNYMILCAKQVMVPRKVAMVLEKSTAQEEAAYRYISNLTGR